MIKSFDEVFEDVTKLGVKIKTDEYHPIGKYQIIDQGQEAVAGYSDLEDGVFENVPAIVFGDHTRIVKYVDQPFFLGADGVKVLRSRFKDANYRYLYYALKSVKIPNTGYNRHFKWLKEAKIYYPNSEEQSKIVLILDGISSVNEHRQRQLQKLDELVKARFVEMFGDRWANNLEWPQKPLKDCATFYNGKAHEQVVDEHGEYILVTSKCIASDQREYRRTNTLLFPLQCGDICMVMSDVPNGRALAKCMMITEDNRYTLNQRICCLRGYSLHTVFFMHVLNRHEYLLSFNDGDSQTNLRKDDLLACPIILPPMDLQEQFAAFVEQTDKSKVAVQKALDEAQLLFDSLMQKYFE